jgi:flagellar FliJ protein
MTALASQVRVYNWALNDKRQKLASLEELADKFHRDLESLETELDHERSAAAISLDGTITFPVFVAAALERRKKLRVSIANLNLEIEAMREEVREAFQEVKKYESARDSHEQRECGHLAKHEQNSRDELGANLHQRKKM